MKEVIGILGYGGKMGTALLSILPGEVPLKLGQRHIFKIDRINTEYQQVDICDAASMRAFTKGITILINCAGPSMKLLDFAAKIAAECGIPYLDAFGGDLLEKKLEDSGVKGSYVLNAGSFPGLTGSLPLEIAATYFERVEYFSLEVFNHENWGMASALDMVYSAINHYGRSNQYYRNGQMVPCKNNGTAITAEGFSKSEYINNETIAVAKILDASEAHFIQRRADMAKEQELRQTIQQYIRIGDDSLLESRLNNKTSWPISEETFKISCIMKGVGKNHEEEVLEELVFPNSYLAGAAIIFHCARKVLELADRSSLGIISAYEIADCTQLIEECAALGAKRSVKITALEEMEEGDI